MTSEIDVVAGPCIPAWGTRKEAKTPARSDVTGQNDLTGLTEKAQSASRDVEVARRGSVEVKDQLSAVHLRRVPCVKRGVEWSAVTDVLERSVSEYGSLSGIELFNRAVERPGGRPIRRKKRIHRLRAYMAVFEPIARLGVDHQHIPLVAYDHTYVRVFSSRICPQNRPADQAPSTTKENIPGTSLLLRRLEWRGRIFARTRDKEDGKYDQVGKQLEQFTRQRSHAEGVL